MLNTSRLFLHRPLSRHLTHSSFQKRCIHRTTSLWSKGPETSGSPGQSPSMPPDTDMQTPSTQTQQTVHSLAQQLLPLNPEHEKNLKLLQGEGFTENQSEIIMTLVAEAIQEGMQSVTKSMITKSEQEKHILDTHAQFANLRNAIQSLAEKNANILQADLEKFKAELSTLEAMIKDQLQRVHGNVILDMNLERGRLKDEVKQLESNVDTIRKGVDDEIKELLKRIDDIKQDLKKTMTRKALLYIIHQHTGTNSHLNRLQDISVL